MNTVTSSYQTLQPTTSSPAYGTLQPNKPNYNISLPPSIPQHRTVPAPAPLMNNLLTPLTPTQQWGASNTTKKPSKDDWGDFDPLS